MIKDMKTINVLNYNSSTVVISTKHDSYAIEPAIDSDNPTILPLTLDEILYANANSMAFKSGILRFPEDIEKEMYEDYLRIPNWESLLTIKQIENIILHPTMEGLTKLVSVKDSGIFDRIRGVFIRLKNTTNDDISLRVEKIIEARGNELRNGIRNTQIVIKARDAVSSVSTDEVDGLKKQNEVLQNQLNEMQAMMAEFLASQKKVNENAVESEKSVVKKKPGRPAKTTK
jgi:hypothetical protein|nr:MAG TPA: hypothetical protein [Caudoviricetes sp.]